MNDIHEELNTHVLILVLKNQLEILRILDNLTYQMNNPTRPAPIRIMRIARPPPEKEDNR